MRLVLGIDDKDFSVNLNSYFEVRALKESLINNFILSMDTDQERTCIEHFKNYISNSFWLNIVAEAFKKAPKTKISSSPPIDFLFSSDKKNSNLIDFLIREQIDVLIEQRKKPIQPQESREDFFKRVFYPFASTAFCLHLFDPYLLSNLFKNKPGVNYILDQHLKSGIKNIVIYTSSKDLNYSKTQIQNKVKSILLKSKDVNGIKINLKVARPPVDRPYLDNLHGRHARYAYSSTQISPVIEMEKGTESFNNNKMNSSHSIRADINEFTALIRERNFINSSMDKFEVSIY